MFDPARLSRKSPPPHAGRRRREHQREGQDGARHFDVSRNHRGLRRNRVFFIGKLNSDKTVTVTARLDGAASFEDLEKSVGPLLK